MIKECKVLSYNKFLNILVFDFDGKQIQTTAKLDTECKTVFVKNKDGKYEIVSKNEYEKAVHNFNKNKVEISKAFKGKNILKEKAEKISE